MTAIQIIALCNRQASDNGMPPDGKWEEMIGRHFVAQASLILEANLSGSAQKFGKHFCPPVS